MTPVATKNGAGVLGVVGFVWTVTRFACRPAEYLLAQEVETSRAVVRSKDEVSKAKRDTAAGFAKDAEKLPYELTAKAVEAYEAAQATCGPRLKVKIDAKNGVRLGPDHPDEAIGIPDAGDWNNRSCFLRRFDHSPRSDHL
jgi:hypothetical protein